MIGAAWPSTAWCRWRCGPCPVHECAAAAPVHAACSGRSRLRLRAPSSIRSPVTSWLSGVPRPYSGSLGSFLPLALLLSTANGCLLWPQGLGSTWTLTGKLGGLWVLRCDRRRRRGRWWRRRRRLHRFLSWQKSATTNKVVHEPSEFRQCFDRFLLVTVVQEEPDLPRIQRCDSRRLA